MDEQLHKRAMKLPRNERLNLASELWDSVRDEDIPVTAAQKKEIRKCLAEIRANPEAGIPLPEFLKKIRDYSRTLRKKQRRSA